MYYSVRATKDTTITNVKVKGVIKSGSNQGASEILELFVLTQSVPDQGKSRVLLYFDIAYLSSSIASGVIPSSSVSYNLVLRHASHVGTNPASFDLFAHALSRSWDEGNGLSMYDETLKDAGFANWSFANSTTQWTLTGSDYYQNISASQHFDTGFEDLNIDITNIVGLWTTGNLANNGLVLKYSDAIETGSTTDVFTKKFFARNSHVVSYGPRIDVKWTNFYQDDRNNIKYNISGILYYYNFSNGTPQNVIQPLYVNILNSSSTVIQTLTASLVDSGIYSISGVFIQPTSSTVIFRDVWFNASQQLFTGNFTSQFATGSQVYNYDQLDVSLSNLEEDYSLTEKAIIRAFARKKDYSPAVVKTGSLQSVPIFLKDAYYQIMNSETGDIIVDFSTGSNKFSKLSYDANGNYFTLWASSFYPNIVYKIKILANYNNLQYIIDKGWTLKVSKD